MYMLVMLKMVYKLRVSVICNPLMTAGAALIPAAVCDEVTHDDVTDMVQLWTTDKRVSG